MLSSESRMPSVARGNETMVMLTTGYVDAHADGQGGHQPAHQRNDGEQTEIEAVRLIDVGVHREQV
jgi:hypothetical protein